MAMGHLSRLQRMALQRHEKFGGQDPLAYVLWKTCQLDLEATLLGHGNCEFILAVMQNNMLSPGHLIPAAIMPGSGAYLREENFNALLHPLLRLDKTVVCHAARVGQLARALRSEAERGPGTPNRLAQWWEQVRQLQNTLATFWSRELRNLGIEGPQAAELQSPRVQYTYQHVSSSLHTTVALFTTKY
jgi:hypothetical protein